VTALRGKNTWVYQLGDHDPSGVGAWRAFRASVCGFLLEEHRDWMARIAAAHPEADLGDTAGPDHDDDEDDGGESVCVFTAGGHVATARFQRLAVTPAQIWELDLPTRPTGQTGQTVATE
jgi:hypothetical protein